MSHFYGTMTGGRGQSTRCGSKLSGLTVVAASWCGAIEVEVRHDKLSDLDMATVRMVPWHGRGERYQLFEGPVGIMPRLDDDPAKLYHEALDRLMASGAIKSWFLFDDLDDSVEDQAEALAAIKQAREVLRR